MSKTAVNLEKQTSPNAAVSTKRAIFVGGGKGGVGKTDISRALLDYYHIKNQSYYAFDGDLENPSLSRFFEEAEPLASQMSEGFEVVVQRLEEGLHHNLIIDLGAGTQRHMAEFEKTLGLAAACKHFGYTPVMLFVLAPSKDSVGLLRTAFESHSVGDGWKFVVARATYETGDWSIWDESKTKKEYADQIKPEYFDIPVLQSKAFTAVEKGDLRYKDVAGGKSKLPYIESSYVSKWFGEMVTIFDSLQSLASK